MKQKPWHIDRRTMLRGSGAAITLPFLDSMAWGQKDTVPAKNRFCTFFIPFGVTGVPKGHRHEMWNWLPEERADGSYHFREVMQSLNPLKDRVSIVQGLHHLRESGGHSSGDGFLTGTSVDGPGAKNTVSVDQIYAHKVGNHTRFSSLVLGLDGGIGAPSRSKTLSYSLDGTPIPARTNVRRIFDQMFSKAAQEKLVADLKRKGSVLDDVLESSKKLNGRVSKRDQAKLDEYLSSIRDLEKRIQKQEAWMQSELPEVDSSQLALEATLTESPAEYLQCMFDIIHLALQTDMTRTVTFQIGSQDAGGPSQALTTALGMHAGHHSMAHGMNKDDGAMHYGKYLQYLTGLYGKFLQRLQDTEEGSGTLLDSTLSLYGSSNNVGGTHGSTNLPIVISGGEAMGFKQGQNLKYGVDVPLSNLYATMLDGLGTPVETFAESNGRLREVLKG
jgi:hypothetical protein